MYDFFKCQNALHQQDYVQFNCDGLKLQIAKILCLIFFKIFLPTIFSLINFFFLCFALICKKGRCNIIALYVVVVVEI